MKKSTGRIPADRAHNTVCKQVSLDERTIKKAKKIGEGNLSLGIRVAVREYKLK